MLKPVVARTDELLLSSTRVSFPTTVVDRVDELLAATGTDPFVMSCRQYPPAESLEQIALDNGRRTYSTSYMPSTTALLAWSSAVQLPLNAVSAFRTIESLHEVWPQTEARVEVTSASVTVKKEEVEVGAKRARAETRGVVQALRVSSALRYSRKAWQVVEMVVGMRGLLPELVTVVTVGVGAC